MVKRDWRRENGHSRIFQCTNPMLFVYAIPMCVPRDRFSGTVVHTRSFHSIRRGNLIITVCFPMMSITLLQNGLSAAAIHFRPSEAYVSFIHSFFPYLSYFEDKKTRGVCMLSKPRWIENRVHILLAIKWKKKTCFSFSLRIDRELVLFRGTIPHTYTHLTIRWFVRTVLRIECSIWSVWFDDGQYLVTFFWLKAPKSCLPLENEHRTLIINKRNRKLFYKMKWRLISN